MTLDFMFIDAHVDVLVGLEFGKCSSCLSRLQKSHYPRSVLSNPEYCPF